MANKHKFHASLAIAATLSMGVVAGAVTIPEPVPAIAQASFSDVEPDYWAYPFIQTLAAENIITGYPDGTFRPRQAIDRDEFAAMVRQAFDADVVRQIPSAAEYFQDVPQGYWAGEAIEEAYQQGFLDQGNDRAFNPRQTVTRLEAIVALSSGLDLTPAEADITADAEVGETPLQQRAETQRPLLFPPAILSMMQPLLVAANVQAQPAPEAVPATTAQPEPTAAAIDITNYYTDADQIPDQAIDSVAAATEANIIANYPDPTQLAPNEALERGTAAAMIHQTLVYLDRLEPIGANVEASNYIVRPDEAEVVSSN